METYHALKIRHYAENNFGIHIVERVMDQKIPILIYKEIALSYESFHSTFMSRPVTYSLRNIPYPQRSARSSYGNEGLNYLTSNIHNSFPDIMKIAQEEKSLNTFNATIRTYYNKFTFFTFFTLSFRHFL